MKIKLFSSLLLFSLFGIALGFFGILYEGVVYGPKLMDLSAERMLFWKNFTSIIQPVFFYIPILPLATIILIFLYFISPKDRVKKQIGFAIIFQLISLMFSFYIVTQINIQRSFGNLEMYADAIPGKVILFNILSTIRLILAAIALLNVFRSYIQIQITKSNNH